MVIQRYLAKEVFITLTALTSILLLIFLSNSFVQYLARSASGSIPGMLILKLMMIEIPNLLGLLLPLGLYMAILIAYGRLYAESEMIVLQACGYTQTQLIKSTLFLAFLTAIITGILVLWVGPLVAKDRRQLLDGGGIFTIIQAIIPERFQATKTGERIFYVTDISRDHTDAKGIFFAEKQKPQPGETSTWRLLWADIGEAKEDSTGEQFVVLKNGKEYKGAPGDADYEIMSFKDYKIRLPKGNIGGKEDMRTVPTAELWPINNPDIFKAAEIQWRLSVPLMTLMLGLLAIPLSKVNPRRGKFAKILPAIIIYVIYANMMFIGRDGIVSKTVPIWLGLWWIHGVILLLALGMIWYGRRKYS